jgi:2-succinyl-5-enolpyruvyl-6-hydroxy-3-cyclohexene-1-carboxylate synthase
MHHLQHIAELGPLLKRHGARHVIISPGSRNAPLILLFTSDADYRCHSIVDERSAGYVALGMARQLGEPVILVITSGTAVLNLSPAIAEAFQQRIPLVVLTADRPREILSQFNNQILDQRAPYFNYCKGFFEFPAEVRSLEELKIEIECIDHLLIEALCLPKGPVHVNLPLTEPLYEPLPAAHFPVLDQREKGTGYVPAPVLHSSDISSGPRVLILAGMGNPDEALQKTLEQLVVKKQAVVVAENISNLNSEHFISTPELLLAGASEKDRESLRPKQVISFGKQVVSKRLKLFVQSLENARLTEFPEDADISAMLKNLSLPEMEDQLYCSTWKELELREQKRAAAYFSELPYGSLSVLGRILDAAPGQCVVHLGNSSTIRFSQLMPSRSDLAYYSNRGTSGIDGSVSSAVGAAMVSDKQHLLVVGDLSFVYDSNALWNKDFPENLKIVVINDGGGGIFRLLDGPTKMPFFEEYSVTHHPVSLKLLSGSFGRGFARADSYEELVQEMKLLFTRGSSLSVLEVDCTDSDNSRIFKELFS